MGDIAGNPIALTRPACCSCCCCRYGYVVPGEGDAVMAEADFEAGTLPAGGWISSIVEPGGGPHVYWHALALAMGKCVSHR